MEGKLLDLYQRHGDELRRFALRFLGCADEAADAVQEVFARLQRQWCLGRRIENPRAWLYRVAGNLCRDRRREWQRREEKREWLPAAEDTGPAPLAELIFRLDVRHLRHCLLRLKKRDRLLLLLYAEGMSYAEMAAITALRPAGVGVALARALARLRRQMSSGGTP